MQLLKKVKSKKVISIVLVFIVSFCTIFTKPSNAETKQLNNNQNKIEITNINNKVIGIKGRDVNMRNSEVITINGRQYKCKKMQVCATAYTNSPSEGGAYAFNGERLRVGHIAADFRVLPLNTKVYIPELNRICTVVDKGSAIKNNKIDIFMNSRQEALQWGIRNITIYILE